MDKHGLADAAKWFFGFFGFLALLLLAVWIWNQQEKSLNPVVVCCAECRAAFAKSPAGIGPEGARCGLFQTAAPLSKPCDEFFSKRSMTVAECA